jgi:hypothetical protein
LGYVADSDDDDDDQDAWRSSTNFMREIESLESRFHSIINLEIMLSWEGSQSSTYEVSIELLPESASVVGRILEELRSMRAVSDVMLLKKL